VFAALENEMIRQAFSQSPSLTPHLPSDPQLSLGAVFKGGYEARTRSNRGLALT
jgi:hypothetical protein